MSTVRDALIGAWKLHSFVFERTDGGPTLAPLGDDPEGLLIYSATGQMAVTLQRRGRPRAHSDDWNEATSEEIDAAFKGFNGYAGSFVVDEEKGAVTHQVRYAWYPNYEGSNQVRFYELDGDFLTLRAGPRELFGATYTSKLLWERIT